MVRRKGLGIGKGTGFKNIIPVQDARTHSLSARGVKQTARTIPYKPPKRPQGEYRGWANFSTWAVRNQWEDNDADWEYVNEYAKKFLNLGKNSEEFGKFLKRTYSKIYTSARKKKSTNEIKKFIEQVGSPNEVHWRQLARAYYQDNSTFGIYIGD